MLSGLCAPSGISQPMLMMGYANPLVAYGTDRFVSDARDAGADGLIVPDLPPEEAAMFADSCAREGLALIFMLAPTSNDHRIAMASQHATGFIYVVSLTGITGARADLPENLTDFIARLRSKTDKPLVLGFGHQHAGSCAAGEFAHGWIHCWQRASASGWR